MIWDYNNINLQYILMPFRIICEAWKNRRVKEFPQPYGWRRYDVPQLCIAFSLFFICEGGAGSDAVAEKSLWIIPSAANPSSSFFFSYFLLSRFFSFSLFSFTFEEKTIESACVCIAAAGLRWKWFIYIRNNRDEHIKREKSKPNHQYIL